ncbi:MAG: hypothetical protein WBV82_18620 [Myxococcaceae bacterium]
MDPGNSRTVLQWILLTSVALSGCVHGRYTYPISSWDAETLYPAVVSVAQQQGHQAYLGKGQLHVHLNNGDRLIWYTQPDGTVQLGIQLGGEVNPADEQVRLASTKQLADRLWQDGMSARQQFGGGNNVVVVAAPGAVVGGPGWSCRTGSDGREACGYDCRLGSSGRFYCASTPDGRCALNSDGSFSCGRNCRLQSSGTHACD